MKKLKMIAGIAMFTLVACQKEEISTSPTNDLSNREANSTLLVKNIKRIEEGGFVERDLQFTYDGNKIKTIVNNKYKNVTKFTYSADGKRITKKEELDPAGILTETNRYSYNKLGQITQFRRNGKTILTFTHKANGVIETKDANSNIDEYTFKGNNLIKLIHNKSNPNNTGESYLYDGKNSPFKNIVGWQQVMFFGYNGLLEQITLQSGSENPVKRENGFVLSGSDSYDNFYNAENYPTKIGFVLKQQVPGIGYFGIVYRTEYTY
jgi:hypothetical protein